MKNVVRPKGQPGVQGRNPAEQYLRVGVRIRPMSETEIHSGQCAVFVANDEPADTIYHSDPNVGVEGGTAYQYDKIFKDASNRMVYDGIARDIVQSSLEGINGTVFAYGQTSTGKTHTMYGSRGESGIIPLAINELFDRVNSDTAREFVLRVSYLEIYNETLRDLLNPTGTDNLKIYLSLNREVCVANLTEQVVVSPQDAHEWLEKGESNRRLASTEMNERSSRSHTIFRLIIEGKDRDPVEGDLAVKRAVLNLVDLAGSERASHTGAEGARLREGGNINKSLLALSTVISKLGDATADHVPFRDSKLTRILQTSLGGNARTAIICTITPASNYAEDTTSTLKFALRAKNVRVQPSVNEILNEDALVIRQKREITNLGKQLAAVTDELQVLRSQALAASCENRGDESPDSKKDESKPRRKTWGPGPPDDLDRDVKPPPPPPATGSAPPADSAADAEAEKTALRRDIEERDARIAELELDIQTVCERLTETESINEELSDQFRFFRAHLDVAKQACAQQGNDLAQARAECNRLAASLEEREREADETKSRLERDVEELRGHAHANAALLEKERQTMAAQMRQAEALLQLEREKYQQLAESSAVRANELKERGAAAAKAEREVNELTELLNEERQAIASLTREREARGAAAAKAEREVKELTELLNEERRAIASLTREREELQGERQKFEQLAAEAEAKESARAGEMEERDREAAENKARLEALSAELQEEREKGELLAGEAEALKKGPVRAGELAERERQLEESERQLEERERQLEERERQLEERKSQLEERERRTAETTVFLQCDVLDLFECLEVAKLALSCAELAFEQEQKKSERPAAEIEALQEKAGRPGELEERESRLDERERELEERECELEERERLTAKTKRQVEELAERLEYERQAVARAEEAAIQQQREKDEQLDAAEASQRQEREKSERLASAEAAIQQQRVEDEQLDAAEASQRQETEKSERLASAEAAQVQVREKDQQLLPAEAAIPREESAWASDPEESEHGTATKDIPERDVEKLAELLEEARKEQAMAKARVAEMADENMRLAERVAKAEQDSAEDLRRQEDQFHARTVNLQHRLAEFEARNKQLVIRIGNVIVRKIREHSAQRADMEEAGVIALASAAAVARAAPQEPAAAQAQPAGTGDARRAAEGERATEIALASAATAARKAEREPPTAQAQPAGTGDALRPVKRKWQAAEPTLASEITLASATAPAREADREPPASQAQPAGTGDAWRVAKGELQPATPLWNSEINLASVLSPPRNVYKKRYVTQARPAAQAQPAGTGDSATHPAEPGNRKRSHPDEGELKERSTRRKRSRKEEEEANCRQQ